MPKKNIETAIASGSKSSVQEAEEEVTFEALGPGGVAVLIHTSTDNRNRTNRAVKYALSKNHGSPGKPGSCAFLFREVGVLSFDAGVRSEEDLLELAVEVGADDVTTVEGAEGEEEAQAYLLCGRTELLAVKRALEEREITTNVSEVCLLPSQVVSAEEVDVETVERLQALIDALEDVDEVTTVDVNLEQLARYPFVV